MDHVGPGGDGGDGGGRTAVHFGHDEPAVGVAGLDGPDRSGVKVGPDGEADLHQPGRGERFEGVEGGRPGQSRGRDHTARPQPSDDGLLHVRPRHRPECTDGAYRRAGHLDAEGARGLRCRPPYSEREIGPPARSERRGRRQAHFGRQRPTGGRDGDGDRGVLLPRPEPCEIVVGAAGKGLDAPDSPLCDERVQPSRSGGRSHQLSDGRLGR